MSLAVLDRLREAWDRRSSLGAEASLLDTNAYRLFCGEKEGIPGLVADRYARVGVLVVHDGTCRLSDQELKQIAEWYLERGALDSVYLKRFVPDRSQTVADPALYSDEPLAGEKAAASIPVQENGLHFLIRPYDGFSTGIFLDQRLNRRFLANLSPQMNVLNCFSYTCAFSVGSARAGAMVTSIDLSRRYLEWGRENFRLNDLAPEGYLFLERDVFRFFKAAEKRGDKYDLIIIDPPSFSRTKEGEVFSLKKDLPRLVAGAFPLLAPNGKLFFSCNYSGWDTAFIRSQARRVLQSAGAWEFGEMPAQPVDFQLESHPLSSFLICRKPAD